MHIRFRLFVPKIKQSTCQLAPEQWHYLNHVRRIQPGDSGELISQDTQVLVKVLELNESELCFELLEHIEGSERQNKPRIILYQALPKQDKFSEIVRCCTEIGVMDYIPVISKRSVPKEVSNSKFTRWERIAESAATQSQQYNLPRIWPTISLAEIPKHIENFPTDTLKLVPWEDATQDEYLSSVLKGRKNEWVILFIGPEGGIDPSEIEALSAADFKAVSLGSSILRVEHAAFYTAAALHYAYKSSERKDS